MAYRPPGARAGPHPRNNRAPISSPATRINLNSANPTVIFALDGARDTGHGAASVAVRGRTGPRSSTPPRSLRYKGHLSRTAPGRDHA